MAKEKKIVYVTIHRNAITGRVCTKKFARENPEKTTVEQRISIKPTLNNFIKYARANGLMTTKQLIEEFLK